MTPMGIETSPTPGGWLDFLIVPSKKETEKARRNLLQADDKELIFKANPLVKEFAEGRLRINMTIATDDGQALVLKGVCSGTRFPLAMVFWNPHRGRYTQFTIPVHGKIQIAEGADA